MMAATRLLLSVFPVRAMTPASSVLGNVHLDLTAARHASTKAIANIATAMTVISVEPFPSSVCAVPSSSMAPWPWNETSAGWDRAGDGTERGMG